MVHDGILRGYALQNLRLQEDALLPELMSGRIEVNDNG